MTMTVPRDFFLVINARTNDQCILFLVSGNPATRTVIGPKLVPALRHSVHNRINNIRIGIEIKILSNQILFQPTANFLGSFGYLVHSASFPKSRVAFVTVGVLT